MNVVFIVVVFVVMMNAMMMMSTIFKIVTRTSRIVFLTRRIPKAFAIIGMVLPSLVAVFAAWRWAFAHSAHASGHLLALRHRTFIMFHV